MSIDSGTSTASFHFLTLVLAGAYTGTVRAFGSALICGHHDR
jgi:hypothetical protein